MARILNAATRGSERGAELIEFAIILPLLLLIIFGIVDFGFLFQRYIVLTNASMEGARIASLPGYEDADAQNRVVAYAVDSGLPDGGTCPPLCVYPADIDIPGTGGDLWPAKQITVTYIHNYSYIAPLAGFSSVTLTARSTMRRQTK